ncbi:diphthine--ammonia ligase [Thermanaeromonas sp. C210]|uniref:Dph6-related ATP pyrophosphatase n=1 Tax=Thermanaeromonas sp. C210 TaxID=2731925 RepID=UPI00155C8777|nr:diphthine--ammonia ligase [Thermanaeromonas sp. C210]GFN23906.1 ATP pyrophosphatase [Thermanaeromonas sp. C210]
MSIKGLPFFCSWSGGKDSCLALYYAIREGGKPRALFTTLAEGGDKTRAHGLPLDLLHRQSAALGIPLVTRATSWEDYTAVFISVLRQLKEQGIEAGVFGDIDLEAHREWVENTCSSAGIFPFLPLWKKPHRELLREFLELGFKATIIAVKDDILDKSLLGKTLDEEIIDRMERSGVDPMGEQGEFHTVVTDGPIFSFPLSLEMESQVLHDGYWFQQVRVAPALAGKAGR